MAIHEAWLARRMFRSTMVAFIDDQPRTPPKENR
jgi:hypothetical protein